MYALFYDFTYVFTFFACKNSHTVHATLFLLAELYAHTVHKVAALKPVIDLQTITHSFKRENSRHSTTMC